MPGSRRLLQGLFPLPARLQPLTRGIENASFDFQRLKFLRGSLKLTFALILTFVLLLSVLIVALAAFGVARRLVAPVGRLIAATRAVGAGRYDTPLPIASNDELGFLVNSFGQMTREIEFASARAQQQRAGNRTASARGSKRCWNACRRACSASIAKGVCASPTARPRRFSASALAQLSRPLARPSSSATSRISPRSPSRSRGIFAAACANGARSSSSTPPADGAC